MLAYIQNEKDVDATRQRVLDDAIVCTARIEVLTLYDYHGLRYPTRKEEKDTTKKKILWLWLRCMPHRAFADFEREWQQKGAHRPSVEARFWFSCARLSELREIARMEGFADQLDPDGDYFSIKFEHRMASTRDVPPGNPPNPFTTDPFRRDQNPEDCEILDEIPRAYPLPSSQLALKIHPGPSNLFENREEAPETYSLWVNSGGACRLEDLFRGHANRLKMRRTDHKAHIFKAFLNRLSSKNNRN
ncbi:hypothetical protein N7513_003159 [Penicillium frequentans]|nr:hypothetical protein N7513_003159 [Penicillium glabrum]